jgi:hypothetical protein
VDGFFVTLFGKLGLCHWQGLDEGLLLLVLLHLVTRSEVQALCEERSKFVML